MNVQTIIGGRRARSATRSMASIKASSLLGISEFMFFFRPTFLNLSAIVRIPFFSYLLMLVNAGILVPFVIYALVRPKKVLKADSVALILFNALFFFLTLTFNPDYSQLFFSRSAFRNGLNVNIYDKIFNVFTSIHVAYVLFRSDDSHKHALDILMLCGRAKFVLLFWQFLFPVDYMAFGYDIALAAMFLFSSYINRKNKIDLILSIVAILEGLFFGNRGCVLGFAALVLIHVFVLEKRRITWKKTAIIVGAAAGYFLLSSEEVVSALMNWLGVHGFSSRTLQMLLSGEVAVDSSRMNIWNKCWEAITQHSILYGYGAYGDRSILWGGQYYAHNLILEVLLDFGVLFGLLFMGIALYYLIKGWKKADLPGKTLIAALGAYAIIKLLISSTFWYEPTLYAMLALCVTAARRKRQPQRRMNPPAR